MPSALRRPASPRRVPPADPLRAWLALEWDRPERSYNPDLQVFLAAVLGYDRQHVVTEGEAGGGFADVQLVSSDGAPWVVGDLKKDDRALTVPDRRAALWAEKRRYVTGLTRYVLFVTPGYVAVHLPNGDPVGGFVAPLRLADLTTDALRTRLAFLSAPAAEHAARWGEFVRGQLPYAYIRLDDPADGADAVRRLEADLRTSFAELSAVAQDALRALHGEYAEYQRVRADLAALPELTAASAAAKRRAERRLDVRYETARRVFDDAVTVFREQFGRDLGGNDAAVAGRILEAFVADTVAALVARILFLRLVEDLGLTAKRRLTNGGPQRWSEFVEQLTSDVLSLVRVATDDVRARYQEPFAPTVFDWIQARPRDVVGPMQRLILRLNAYDFATLSEEVLGDIYQTFLPKAKRKRLGEYYTPKTIVDWLLDAAVGPDGGSAPALDPSCGSGSFIVRLLHRRLASAAARGLDPVAQRAHAEQGVWGFDLNPFAAFISHFQVLWGLLRYCAAGDAPTPHVYHLNSLLSDRDLAAVLPESDPGPEARDGRKWRVIVGNPPYIRAERVKYDDEMRATWADVWGGNGDTGLVFLHRALTEWLEPGGTLAMVVSAGYANSEAAEKVWRLLHPGAGYMLRKIGWLEFVAADVWEPDVLPMLLVIEKRAAADDDVVEVSTPTTWPSTEPPVRVRYGDFFDRRVNPVIPGASGHYGHYLLPFVQPDDVPILRDLFPGAAGAGNAGATGFVPLGQAVAWTYGVKKGTGGRVTSTPEGSRPRRVVKGMDVAAGLVRVRSDHVDLDAVSSGNRSLWRDDPPPDRVFVFVPTITVAPTAAVAPAGIAALNSVLVAEFTSAPLAKAVAAYVNSALARFVWATRLRSAVLLRRRSTLYPRTLKGLPWPAAGLTPSARDALAAAYDALAAASLDARLDPDAWIVAHLDALPAADRVQLTDCGLDLSDWSEDVVPGDLVLDPTAPELAGGAARVRVRDQVTAAALQLVLSTLDADAALTRRDLQRLALPRDVRAFVDGHAAVAAQLRAAEPRIAAAMARVDAAAYDAFGVAAERRAYIDARLRADPLGRLQPRLASTPGKEQAVRAYAADRFA